MILLDILAKSRIVVDTDVVSFIFGDRPQAQFFRPFLQNKTLAVSFITIAELFYGAYHAKWGNNRISGLERHLKNYVVLPYDYDMSIKWAEIRITTENKHLSIEDPDCWIAACAMRHDCALATNNGKHYQHLAPELALISPSLI